MIVMNMSKRSKTLRSRRKNGRPYYYDIILLYEIKFIIFIFYFSFKK